MNTDASLQPADVILICCADPALLAVLQRVAHRLGCDRLEVRDASELATALTMRSPTLAVLSIDGADIDSLRILHMLAKQGVRPATLLIGDQDGRVLAGVQRFAGAHGLPIISTRRRPILEAEVEQLLMNHMMGPLPIQLEELEFALAEHEFQLQYQPKVRISGRDMQVIGVEALVRWHHPHRGILLPGHFLEAIERHGMTLPLTDFVITAAMRQAGAWHGHGINLQMAINLSPQLVRDRAFPDRLATLLREQDVSPALVTLDVTETSGTHDRELVQEVFTQLRVMGLGLSLDNFGTGHSSLSELYRTPYSEIKIDRRFLEDARRDGDAELILRSVVRLAHDLRLTVCAEGVESSAALEFVRDTGCDFAQGRIFSEPASPTRIEELLTELSRSSTAGTGVWRALRDSASKPRYGRLPSMQGTFQDHAS